MSGVHFNEERNKQDQIGFFILTWCKIMHNRLPSGYTEVRECTTGILKFSLCSQFFERLKIIFMPVKHQPDLMFLRQVPLNRIHIFTVIQLLCLGVLWLIKSTDAALIFPVMVCILYVLYLCENFCQPPNY